MTATRLEPMTATALPVVAPVESSDLTAVPARPFQLVIWDDPVNLMSYVAYVFRSYFGFDRPTADTLMLRVHQEGKAVVAEGSKERIEADVSAMHGFGLQATMRQADHH